MSSSSSLFFYLHLFKVAPTPFAPATDPTPPLGAPQPGAPPPLRAPRPAQRTSSGARTNSTSCEHFRALQSRGGRLGPVGGARGCGRTGRFVGPPAVLQPTRPLGPGALRCGWSSPCLRFRSYCSSDALELTPLEPHLQPRKYGVAARAAPTAPGPLAQRGQVSYAPPSWRGRVRPPSRGDASVRPRQSTAHFRRGCRRQEC
mmetsp:Transcript_48708/g.137029  ORF Transcript_48708/g.137029 Transcript_48708/m.137029 type:complete len:202 (+) Transcript_48708:434-1039(+)